VALPLWGGAVAAACKLVLPDSLVPGNVPALKDFTAIAVLLSLVFAWAAGERVVRHRRRVVVCAALLACVALVSTYLVYDRYVRDIGTFGNEPHTRLVVGSRLTADGKAWERQSGRDSRGSGYVHWIGGRDGIDRAWSDASRNRRLYSGSIVLLAVSLVFALGLLHVPAATPHPPQPPSKPSEPPARRLEGRTPQAP
jgi:hypothetical protein